VEATTDLRLDVPVINLLVKIRVRLIRAVKYSVACFDGVASDATHIL
jgi:hypothetical protein